MQCFICWRDTLTAADAKGDQTARQAVPAQPAFLDGCRRDGKLQAISRGPACRGGLERRLCRHRQALALTALR